MTPGNLLIVARGDEGYGVGTKLFAIAREMAARGWRITLYALSEGDFSDRIATLPDAHVIVDPVIPRRFVGNRRKIQSYLKLLLGSVSLVKRLRSMIATRDYDAVLFSEHGLVLPLSAACARMDTPVFWFMANVISGNYFLDINRRLYRLAFATTKMIPIANSRHTRATLARAAGYAQVVDLGVDAAPFLAEPGPDPLAGIVPEGAVRIAVIARLTSSKGQHVLLKELLATPEAADAHLILCGGPTGSAYEARLRRIAQTAGQGHRLHIIGPVADPTSYFAHCDIVANARLDAEPFGLSIVEGMFSAKPVLAHALGGPQDIVVDGETGWLIPEMTPTNLHVALHRVMRDRPRWATMGVAGRARAQSHFTAQSMVDQLLAIFARHGVGQDTAGVQRD